MGLSTVTHQEKNVIGGHPPIKKLVTLAIDATAREKGTVLGKVSGSGEYAPYVDTNNDGTQTAVAVLLEDVPVHAAAVEALVLVHGDVVREDLVGLDANGEADLYAAGIFVGEE